MQNKINFTNRLESHHTTLKGSPNFCTTSQCYQDIICLACGGGQILFLWRPPVVWTTMVHFFAPDNGHQLCWCEVHDHSCLSERICGMAEWRNGGLEEWRNGRMAEWRTSGMVERENGWMNDRMAERQNGGISWWSVRFRIRHNTKWWYKNWEIASVAKPLSGGVGGCGGSDGGCGDGGSGRGGDSADVGFPARTKKTNTTPQLYGTIKYISSM